MRPAVLSIWKGLVTPSERPRARLAELIGAVADAHLVTADEIRSRDQTPEIFAARLDFYRRALAAGQSQSAIGRFVGRDHSSVHSAVHGTGKAKAKARAAAWRARQEARP